MVTSGSDPTRRPSLRLLFALAIVAAMVTINTFRKPISADQNTLSASTKESVHHNKRHNDYPMSINDFLRRFPIHSSNATSSGTTTGTTPLSSPACRPTLLKNGKRIERIYFLHMRKAGGTTIRRYLSKVANRYNITFHTREGRKTALETPAMEDDNDDDVTNMRSTTLYVTNLREPNARTISNYKFSQRWSCRDLVRPNFVPTLNNTQRTLEQYIKNRNKGYKKRSLWECANNCYTRWVTGNYKPLDKTCSPMLRRNEVKRVLEARNILLKYNLIIVSEWMRDQAYVNQVENMFDVAGLTEKEIYPFCARPSARANANLPLVISNKTRQLIDECNTPDSCIYNQITTCPNGFEFPRVNRSIFQ